MTRKHNTKHDQRSQSKYPERLKKRGMTNKSVRMTAFDTSEARKSLRKRQGAHWEAAEEL